MSFLPKIKDTSFKLSWIVLCLTLWIEPKLARVLLVQAQTHPCKPEAIWTVPIAETEVAADIKDVLVVEISDRQIEQVAATPAFA